VGAKKGQTRKSAAAGRQRLALVGFGVLLVGLFVGFAVAQGIGAPSVPSGDVALVEGVPEEIGAIGQDEFDRELLQQAAQGGEKKAPKPGDDKYEELEEAAMGELLNRVWLQGEAEELDIEVTEKQIDTELEQIKGQNFKTDAEYEKFLESSHFSEEDVLERVELQLLSTQIQEQMSAGAPPASAGEVEAYYEGERETQFTEPATREARIIVNKDKAKVEEAKAELEKDNSPGSWKKVAAEVSEDPNTKDKGGLQAGLSEELLQGQPELSAALFENDAGVIVGPTPVAGKFFITEVVKLKPSKTQSLDEVRAQIKSQLDQQRQQEFFAEFVAEYQSKWEARTVCAEGFVIEQCSNYVGDGHPSTASPACYEADPKGGPAKDCPAPVQQPAPALPGSVTETSKDGTRLPQRPRPEGLKETGEAEVGLPGGAVPPPISE
jgi:foldase protein PrsA